METTAPPVKAPIDMDKKPLPSKSRGKGAASDPYDADKGAGTPGAGKPSLKKRAASTVIDSPRFNE
jgi:hypothetical protein